MLQQEIEIINKLGLHARASAKLTQLAMQFSCSVNLDRDGKKADAKSIMSLMMLAAAKGSRLTIETHGSDEAAAMEALVGLINNRFEEDE